MRTNRETLIRIAKETAQKRAFSDPGLIAVYLTGSLLSGTPFLGNSTDIDIVFVHADQPTVRREILPLTADIHLDIVHNPRSQYEKPKELRVHPWLGPELYNPLPLYGTQHFFEFVQAGVRAGYEEPSNVLERAHRNADHARQIWSGLTISQEDGPTLLLSFLKAVDHAANAIALLTGGPLAERRFLLQFQERAEAVGAAGLAAGLMGLLGGHKVDEATLSEFIKEWEISFVEGARQKKVHASIAFARLPYYKQAFDSMLTSGSPQTVLWPLLRTWTLAVADLLPNQLEKWMNACETLGLAGEGFNERLEGLDHFLDTIEELLENWAVSHGV